jgi:hypothetical protein
VRLKLETTYVAPAITTAMRSTFRNLTILLGRGRL